MKSKTRYLTALLGLALALPLTQLKAGEAKAAPAAEVTAPKGEAGRGNRLQKIFEALEVTEEQKAKLKPIFQEEAKALKAIQADETLDKQAKWAKVKAVREEYKPQIRAILTPEQNAKLEAMEDKREKAPRAEKRKQKAE